MAISGIRIGDLSCVPMGSAAPAASRTVGLRPVVLAGLVLLGGATAYARVPTHAASGRAAYLELVRRTALAQGAPADLAAAVAQIESGYDPRVVGTVGEVGLMQVRPQTASMLGFRGSAADLARPEANVRYGVAYLAKAWRIAGGDVCRALAKYRAGHGSERISPLSQTYCRRARAHLASIGSPLARGMTIPAEEFARAGPKVPGVTLARAPSCRRGTAACSRTFWAAHEARIRAISRRIVAQWRARGARGA